ncbi:MAG: DUF1015 domain-containing protein [Ruminiclostridium sp.]|nr:DUF1015 domain-containing protein [Ruminiclostridium sp.]
MKRTYGNIGVHIPEIMLPAKGSDLCKWAVVACDQYTSQPDYWDDVKKIVGGSPSTLYLTFPEIYLKDDDKDQRIININSAMDKYLSEGILELQKPGFILLDRSTGHAASRKGLIIALDLEKYDYNKGSQTLIRATEGTVLDRIPPRVRIREHAAIELPHIMALIDDPGKTVVEPLFEKTHQYEKVYDFELMKNGGHIKGWKIDNEESLEAIAAALEKLAQPEAFHSKYGAGSDKGVLLFAVGDGNHSLATAKAHWENLKASSGQDIMNTHPARYALVEIVNVHDDGIIFEPIHRVLFGVGGAAVLDEFVKCFETEGESSGTVPSACKAEYMLLDSEAAIANAVENVRCDKSTHAIPFVLEGVYGLLLVKNPAHNLEVGTLQAALDKLAKNHRHMEIDYIHGDREVTELSSRRGNMGFYLPSMDKHDLFKTVILEGVLPRKTFSMGEADEKRFYLECRKIV